MNKNGSLKGPTGYMITSYFHLLLFLFSSPPLQNNTIFYTSHLKINKLKKKPQI